MDRNEGTMGAVPGQEEQGVSFTGTAYPAGTAPQQEDRAAAGRTEPAPGFSARREDDPLREGTPRSPFSPADPRAAGEGRYGEDARLAELDRADAAAADDSDAEDGEHDGPLYDENGLPLTEEERAERRKPVAAVPPSVALEDIEPVEGFRLPRDQPEAELARQQAEREAEDASRPEVAQRIADEAKDRADAAAEEARSAQERADQAKADYDGPDRPPLHEGWRYKRPEPGPHDPV